MVFKAFIVVEECKNCKTLDGNIVIIDSPQYSVLCEVYLLW